jgi:hypothetical protein
MRWTRNTIAAAVFGGALILGSGAAAAGVLVASSHSAVIAVAPADHAAPAKTTPAPVPTKTVTAPPAPVPTKTVTAPPPAQPSDWQPSSAPAAAPADSQFTNSVAVVTQYYQDITNHDYTDAWNLGGSNIAAQNGQTYDSWVTGYDTTASISLVGQANWNSGAVQTSISAVQTDGSVNTYYGTYYVTNGVITSANIAQTS